jgi:NAD(P)-dependent dehydrogenase (short-subunit alcohol dehydrogenase family)
VQHASFVRALASEPFADNVHRTDEPAFTAAIQSVPAQHGRLDALVLNAGVLDPMTRITSLDMPLDAWRAHFDVNVFSLVTALKAAVPSLRESRSGGKVIFVSSGAAVGGIAGWGPYNASKAAMNALNRYESSPTPTWVFRSRSCSPISTLATEEKGKIVSVALRPGKVDTAVRLSRFTWVSSEAYRSVDARSYS